MKFAALHWLWIGLAACGGLAWLFHRDDRRRTAALASFASSHLLEKLTASISPRRRAVKRWLLLVGIASLFVALARPQMGFYWQEARQRSVDVLFAVDTSKSMLSQDVKPDRLTRAKMAVEDLADRIAGDRLGLVAFAGDAFLQCPLTLDADAFRQSVDALDTATIPRGGTNISSAIQEAQAAFHSEGGNEKIMILLTDGEDLEGSAVAAAKDAAKEGLKIYTIGVGTPAGELIPVPSEGGGTDFVRDASGQIVKSRLDEGRMKEIAEATGGFYRPLGPRGEGLTELYQSELATLSKDQEADRKVRVPIERFAWPLAFGLLLLLIEPLIGTRRGGAPRPVADGSQPPRKRWLPRGRQGGLPAAGASLLIALAMLGAAQASPEAGAKAFEKGDYEKAEQEFDAAAKRNAAPEIELNLGSAAYKNNRFDKASESYQSTLRTSRLDVQQQAYYNLGDAQYRLGQQTEKSDTKQTMETWKQAIEAYESALQLKPDDADAKFNRDFVKRKLDELQKKSPQDKNSNSGKDKNKDQQQSKDQSKSDSNNSQNQNQSQSQQNQNQSQNQSQNQNQQNQQNPSPSQNQQGQNPNPSQNPQDKNGSPDGQKPPEQGKPEPKPGDDQKTPQPGDGNQPKPENGDAQQGQGQGKPIPGQMTPEEAKGLLNSLRGDEKKLPMNQKGNHPPQPPEKDW